MNNRGDVKMRIHFAHPLSYFYLSNKIDIHLCIQRLLSQNNIPLIGIYINILL